MLLRSLYSSEKLKTFIATLQAIYFTAITTTDLAGMVAVTRFPSTVAPFNTAGFTASGFSKVLWSVIFPEVSTIGD